MRIAATLLLLALAASAFAQPPAAPPPGASASSSAKPPPAIGYQVLCFRGKIIGVMVLVTRPGYYPLDITSDTCPQPEQPADAPVQRHQPPKGREV